MKNVVFWDVTSCDSCKNRRFGGRYWLYHQGDKKRLAKNDILLVTANVPRSLIHSLMMEVIRSSETSVLTRATRCNTLENSNLRLCVRCPSAFMG
jgi:hypothetical protein